MNPFDLTGPAFLFFYLVLAIAVIIGLHYFRKLNEGGDAPQFDTSDPYLIAALRGGIDESARVATVSLIERKLLQAGPDGKIKLNHEAAKNARNQFEQAVIAYFKDSPKPAGLFNDRRVIEAGRHYYERLQELGALPSPRQKQQRFTTVAVGVGFLALIGVIKIAVALARDRTNIGFLMILMVLSAVAGALISFPRLTALGSTMLEDLQTLFSRLKTATSASRVQANPSQAAMLAAVFGMASMPALAYPYVRQVFPQASSSDAASSSCGSSSSSGDSGGSSCGGGCGGGCGGCGS